jgi:hypothetical protein
MKASENKEEERRFTLRISSAESKAIEELKTLFRENTDSAVVRNVIMNHASLQESLKQERQKCASLMRERDDLKAKIEMFCNAFDQLSQIHKKKK